MLEFMNICLEMWNLILTDMQRFLRWWIFPSLHWQELCSYDIIVQYITWKLHCFHCQACALLCNIAIGEIFAMDDFWSCDVCLVFLMFISYDDFPPPFWKKKKKRYLLSVHLFSLSRVFLISEKVLKEKFPDIKVVYLV